MKSYQDIQLKLQESKDTKEIKNYLIEYYGQLNSDSKYIQEVNAVIHQAEFHLKKSLLEKKLNRVFLKKLKVANNEETHEDQLQRVLENAKNKNIPGSIPEKTEKSPKLATILDFDDTLGSHAPSIIESDFLNDAEIVDKRYRNDKIHAIPASYQLYKLALELDVAVFVVSYRKPLPASEDRNLRKYVVNNLTHNGITVHEKNVCLPEEHELHLDSIAYKTNVRDKITADGYKIALIVGDQESDFPRDEAHRKDKGHFLLPNKLYGKFSLLGTQTHVTGTPSKEIPPGKTLAA